MSINLDYAASGNGSNPSAIHEGGRVLREHIEACRAEIARLIHAKPHEIYFTSGGTESNNWAIKGIAWANQHRGKHIITSQIEHPSVLEPCKFLERQGFEVTYLPVDSSGYVHADDVTNAIRPDTVLISIMGLNNEIGTYQDTAEIGTIAKMHGVPFHSDFVQRAAARGLDVERNRVDLASVSGHKFGAKNGIGFLYVREGVQIEPLIHGGHQQNGMRAGTETNNLIGNITERFRKYMNTISETGMNERMLQITRYMFEMIRSKIPDVRLNGAPIGERAYGNLNLCFPGVDGEALTMLLSAKDVYVSRGSACSAGEYTPSYVLKAIGLSDEEAMSSIRISIPPFIFKAEAYAGAEKIVEAVKTLRGMNHAGS